MVDLDRNFQIMKKQIYSHMLKTRGMKYKWFLRCLRSFKYLSLNPKRGDFLESYYIMFRLIDNVVDRDVALPDRFSSRVEFVEDKINFSQKLRNPKDNVDYLMLYCFELADEFGEDFFEETRDILLSLRFDAKRIGKRMVFSELELNDHFYLLDIRGTIKAALKVFSENPDQFKTLEPLGFASRIFYNLRDYSEDIRVGLINISTEDMKRYGISKDILLDTSRPEIRKWFIDQTQKGISCLKEYQRNMVDKHFRFLTKITLSNVYVWPAERFFQKV